MFFIPYFCTIPSLIFIFSIIQTLDYPDYLVESHATSPDNRGSTVVCARFRSLQLVTKKIAAIENWKITGWQNFNDLKHSL